MILTDGTEIRRTDPYRSKFADAMTEYLHQLSLNSGWDEASGNVDCSTGWFARFGRRMLFEDSQGFVESGRWPTEREAIEVFNALANIYNEWDSDPEED